MADSGAAIVLCLGDGIITVAISGLGGGSVFVIARAASQVGVKLIELAISGTDLLRPG
jgi:hypothetical protein